MSNDEFILQLKELGPYTEEEFRKIMQFVYFLKCQKERERFEKALEFKFHPNIP